VLLFIVWGLSILLCVESSWSSVTSRLERDQPPISFSRSLFELRRRPGYVSVLNLVSFGYFEFSLDLCSFGIPDRLSSECFETHRRCDVGVGARGRLPASGYLGLFSYCFFLV
jgi:hypothetical protein